MELSNIIIDHHFKISLEFTGIVQYLPYFLKSSWNFMNCVIRPLDNYSCEH